MTDSEACLEGKVAPEVFLPSAISWHPVTLSKLGISWANIEPCKNIAVSKLATLGQRECKNTGRFVAALKL